MVDLSFELGSYEFRSWKELGFLDKVAHPILKWLVYMISLARN